MIIQVLVIFIVPVIILILRKKYEKISFLSPVLIAYVIGLLYINIGFKVDSEFSLSISEFAVPLAIPLILFAVDFVAWSKMSKKTVISFFLVIVSATLASILGFLIFKDNIPEANKVAGMLVGVYTGGTPNLMAIGQATNVSTNILIQVNGADFIVGGIYFFIVISVLKPILKKILPAYSESAISENIYSLSDEEKKVKIALIEIGVAFLIALIIVAISVGVSMIVFGKLNTGIVLLLLKSLSIWVYFIKELRKVKWTYELGEYFILVFSVAMGSLVKIPELFNSIDAVFMNVLFVVLSCVIIHVVLAKIFKIDVDTVIITSSAGIYGPAFIPSIAESIKNRNVIVSGLTSGLVGYAIGNYLGVLIYYLL